MRILFVLLLSLCFYAHAEKDGISFSAQYGIPDYILTDSSNTQYIYSGYNLDARVHVPLYDFKGPFSVKLSLGTQILSLENTANSDSFSENAQHSGYGYGLQLSVYRLYAGINFDTLEAKHYWNGAVNSKSSFKYNSTHTYVGMGFRLVKTIMLTVTMKQTTGNIPQLDNDIMDLDLNNTTYMFGISIDTSTSFTDAFKAFAK